MCRLEYRVRFSPNRELEPFERGIPCRPDQQWPNALRAAGDDQSQCHGFMPPQAAREQQCEQCSVAFSFQSLMIGCLPKCLALLRSQLIAEAHSQLLHAFNAANTSRQIGAEETAVGGLVCEPALGTET